MEDNKNKPLPEDSPTANEEAKQKPEETKKDFWVVAKIKAYAKANPKRTFFIMMGLLALSIVASIGQYVYIKKVVSPRVKERSTFDFVGDFEETYTQPVEQGMGMNYFELKEIMKELDYYKNKEVLTEEDSVRIKYLIDKYNPKRNEKD